jgi:phosphoglycerate kinase
MKIRTINDIPGLSGKKVLLRVDFNVPINENGEITDDTRISESLPTIKKLIQNNAKIIIMSHLGRPEGKIVENLRLDKVAQKLSSLLDVEVKKSSIILGEETDELVSQMKNGEIVMLENIRFSPDEEICGENFTRNLSSLGDMFINDAFGTAHRKHSSTAGLADYLPSYAGLLMEKEITSLSPVLEGKTKTPLTMIFGGAKIDTKIGVIQNFLDRADFFLIGGALSNTFLAAKGLNVGDSLYEKDKLDVATDVLNKFDQDEGKQLALPYDVVCAKEISDDAEVFELKVEDIESDMKILDLGKHSVEQYCEVIRKSGTVVWNGPLGLAEYKPFQEGTRVIANFLAKQDCVSIIGGGDTAAAIKDFGIDENAFTHVSTGGGACIEFLSGEKLPGIEVLRDE